MSFSSSPIASLAEGLDGNGGTSSAIDTTGCDLLIVSVSSYDLTANPAVSDSKSNTWIPLTNHPVSGGDTTARIWYAKNPTVGSGHTFTVYSTGAIYCSVSVTGWSGAHLTAPADQENGAGSSGVTAISTGSVTPSEGNELLIAAVTADATGTFSIDGGFTIAGQVDYVVGHSEAGAQAYLVQTSATAANPQWSRTGSATLMAAAIATFQAAAGGGGETLPALDQGMLTGGLSNLCGGLA